MWRRILCRNYNERRMNMKANEAPEKIYRTTTYLDNDKGKTLWKEAPVKGAENIEYTHTDAFIEKACSWLNDNAIKYWGTEFVDNGEMIEDFRNYMKGE